MKTAYVNDAEIAYIDEGRGPPILLIHGFASNAQVNWVGPGWVTTLSEAGYRVIAIDNRGHGQSTKFYDEADYRLDVFASDAAAIIDQLGLDRPHVMGYSLGARITATLASKEGSKLNRIILAGNGYNMVDGGFDSSAIRDGLLAESASAAPTEIGKGFRAFAEATKSDLKALAACIMGGRAHIDKQVFQSIENETLVTIGDEDTVATQGDKLATLLPRGRFEPIPKRNHNTAVGDKVYKQNVLGFLSE